MCGEETRKELGARIEVGNGIRRFRINRFEGRGNVADSIEGSLIGGSLVGGDLIEGSGRGRRMGSEVGGNDVLVGFEKAPGCLVRRATPLRKVLSPRQGIGDGIASSRAVDNDKVETREELGPAGLTAGEGFGGGKVLERLVIGVDGER